MRKLTLALATLTTAAATLVAPNASALSSGGTSATKAIETMATNTTAYSATTNTSPTSTITTTATTTGTIWNDTTDWTWLKTPTTLTPGTKITTGTTACTAGWIVTKNNTDYLLTAGHCAQEGTTISTRDTNTTLHPIGTVTERHHNPDQAIDWELITINPTTNTNPHLPLTNPTGEVYTTEQATHADAICLLGQVSGLSCGTYQYTSPTGRLVFEATSTHGDSGAPIFALKNGTLHPLGILEGGYDGTNNISAITLDRIIPALGIDTIKA